MNTQYKKFYFITLGVLLIISAYPIIMGFKMMFLYLSNGIIQPEQYIKGVIPYVSICISIILVTAFHPIFSKIFKKFQLLITSALSWVLFVIIELLFESIKINTKGVTPLTGTSPANTIDAWQSTLCYVSPQAIDAARAREQASKVVSGFDYISSNISFKIHYFLVSFVIIMLVLSIIYGFGKMVKNVNSINKDALFIQLISVSVLISLCIFASVTGFFRDFSPILNPVSSTLTSVFFITLGVSFGVYIGSFLLKKSKYISILVPAIASIIVIILMYFGEYVLLNGKLYVLGESWIFNKFKDFAVAPIDIIIVLLTGIITGAIFAIIKNKSNCKNEV